MSDSNEMICWCAGVSKDAVVRAVMAGNTTLEQLRQVIGVCPENNDCTHNNPKGRCCAQDVLALVKHHAPSSDDAELCCPCCKQD